MTLKPKGTTMPINKPDRVEELKKLIKSGQKDGVYVFFGEEEYLKQHYYEMLKKSVTAGSDDGFAEITFDALDFEIDVFLDEVQNISFGASDKFIVLRNLDTDVMSEGDRRALFSALDDDLQGICILFYYDNMFLADGEYDKIKRRKKMIDTLSKHGFAVEFKRLSVNVLVNWITKGFASQGMSVTYDVAKYLLSVCGADMFNLKNEITKIALYAKGEEITKETLDRLITRSLERNVFSIAEDVVCGRISSALKTVDTCRSVKEQPTVLISIIGNTFRELLIVSAAKDKRLSQADTLKALNLSPARSWLIKDYERLCSKRTLSFFVKANLELAQCEQLLKGSGCDKWQAIELALIKINGLK